MFIVVTKQIGIEADTIEAGIAAVANGEGKTIGLSATERTQAQQVQASTSGSPRSGVIGSQQQKTTTGQVP